MERQLVINEFKRISKESAVAEFDVSTGQEPGMNLPCCSHTWELAPALEHRAEFPQFLNKGQLVGLLGRVISSSQGLYVYTNTETHTHIHKH
jgi:hypothetical protein